MLQRVKNHKYLHPAVDNQVLKDVAFFNKNTFFCVIVVRCIWQF